MTDIATNICTWPSCGHTANGQCKTRNFDVDLITTLRAEVERLRAALLDIFDYECRNNSHPLIACTARNALWPDTNAALGEEKK